MLRREVAINRLIVLTVVTEQQPLDLGELARQALQIAALVLATAAEPAVGGRSPVGQQQRPAGYRLRDRKRVKVGATFQAPVDR